tara:strand:- start:52 stop:450 length:399 start_codon:yes stop_codon:yes gene_type:complete
MFSKDTMIGVFIGLANCEIRVESDYRSTLGYTIKPKLQIRAEMPFLNQVSRSLWQVGISSHIREIESKLRKKPILTISRISSLKIISDMIPLEYADARNQWSDFRTIIELMYNKKHLTLEGLDEILKIKGLI